MKTNVLRMALVAAVVSFAGCKGDKGELGPAGNNGLNSLTRTTAEPAGANCATGGAKIESGVDTNGNGTLEDGEVKPSLTRYLCNGASGANSVTKISVETAGGNCATGGVKIEVGIDANGNGALDATEVVTAMTRYICNGATGAQSLIRTTEEPAGANCSNGGVKFEMGVDANGNGVLDNSEVTTAQTRYVCNGAPGTANVYYSDWMVVNDTKWVETDRNIQTNVPHTDYYSNYPYTVNRYDDTTITYAVEIPTPKVTQDILDRGVVYYYIKDMTTPSDGKVFPYTMADWWVVGVTNRTQTGSLWSMDYLYEIENASEDGAIQKDKFTLRTYWRGSGSYFDATPNNRGQHKYDYDPERILYNELKPKTNFAIRYVVIPGGQTGKLAGVNFKNYEEVKNLFNLKD